MKTLKTVSGVPKIGIFYYIDTLDEVLGSEINAHSVGNTPGGYKMSPDIHIKYWKNSVLKIRPQLSNYSWDYFPRGRVISSNDNQNFLVYLDKHADKIHVKSLIREEFNLPATTRFFIDEAHYLCYECKKHL